jgi:hypothetical protein
MDVIVSKDVILEWIKNSLKQEKEFDNFKSFVFNYNYAEDKYIFENGDLERIFLELSIYFEFYETYGDPDRNIRFKRIMEILEKGYWTQEHFIYAKHYDKLDILNRKLKKGLINQKVFLEQVKKLSPIDFNIEKVISYYNMGLL